MWTKIILPILSTVFVIISVVVMIYEDSYGAVSPFFLYLAVLASMAANAIYGYREREREETKMKPEVEAVYYWDRWTVKVTIGVQTFYLDIGANRSEDDAKIYVKWFKYALNNVKN